MAVNGLIIRFLSGYKINSLKDPGVIQLHHSVYHSLNVTFLLLFYSLFLYILSFVM